MKDSGNKPIKHKDAAPMKVKEGMKSGAGMTPKPAEAPRPSKMPRMPERKPS